jgi:hypothetical protein
VAAVAALAPVIEDALDLAAARARLEDAGTVSEDLTGLFRLRFDVPARVSSGSGSSTG